MKKPLIVLMTAVLAPLWAVAEGIVKETGSAGGALYHRRYTDDQWTVRSKDELKDLFDRLRPMECGAYVYLRYANTGVLVWKGDGLAVEKINESVFRRVITEHFYREDVETVGRRIELDRGDHRDLRPRVLPSGNEMFDVIRKDAEDTPSRCPTS